MSPGLRCGPPVVICVCVTCGIREGPQLATSDSNESFPRIACCINTYQRMDNNVNISFINVPPMNIFVFSG